MLLWWFRVSTNPQLFVIATRIPRFWNIYPLVSCNKQRLIAGKCTKSSLSIHSSFSYIYPILHVQERTRCPVIRINQTLLASRYQEVNTPNREYPVVMTNSCGFVTTRNCQSNLFKKWKTYWKGIVHVAHRNISMNLIYNGMWRFSFF